MACAGDGALYMACAGDGALYMACAGDEHSTWHVQVMSTLHGMCR